MKVAVAQISCVPGDLAANLNKVRDFASRARDAAADLVVFPEMIDTGYSMDVIRAQASQWNEGAVPQLQSMAKNLGITIVAGVSEREGERIYNAQVFVNPAGQVIAKYRKTHLFAAPPIEEHKCFSAGDVLTAVDFSGFRLGLSICYDLRFPEVYRLLSVDSGANVFIISSAWPFPRVEHFRTLALARAIENQSYVVAANRVGTDDEVTFCGCSAIVDPYGVMIAGGSTDREELLVAELSLQEIEAVRSRMAIFADRREEIYRKR